MRKKYLLVALMTISLGIPVCYSQQTDSLISATKTLSKATLQDKVKGGWAGKTIGCTYGGPIEYQYNGMMVQDYIPIEWNDDRVKFYYDTFPGLYDDLYMDLSFVDVFAKLGLDAPIDSFALKFAKAGYTLWHANQSARYNILHGIMPPASGNWLNNPHADDIDYQIEADYAGLMSPGMPNTASEFSDKIGHMITYGNGWYGGVFVGAMYSEAFVSNDINQVVSEALKTIPENSDYYRCMSDIIKWHNQYPNDWKSTWFECQKKWSEDVGCPDGVFLPLDIDAILNSAYVTIGLLYGQGDFAKTIDIATRCGEDADCNPSTAGGILGTMLGYSNIPEYWKKSLNKVADRDFSYTDISLNKAYDMTYKLALDVLAKHGVDVSQDSVTLTYQQPVAVKYEKSFEGLYPVSKIAVGKQISKNPIVSFEGTGVVFKGYVESKDPNYVAKVEMTIDGKKVETASLPASYQLRRNDLFWNYQLSKGKHTATFKWLNPQSNSAVNFGDAIIYSDTPNKPIYQ